MTTLAVVRKNGQFAMRRTRSKWGNTESSIYVANHEKIFQVG